MRATFYGDACYPLYKFECQWLRHVLWVRQSVWAPGGSGVYETGSMRSSALA